MAAKDKKKKSTRKTGRVKQSKGKTVSDSGNILNMQEAIDLLKTTQPTFYRWLREGKIKGMKVGRQWRFHRDDIERFMRGEEPRVDVPSEITPFLKKLEKRLRDAGVKSVPRAGTELQRAFDLMLQLGAVLNASDIHIDVYQDHDLIRYRVYGELIEIARIDSRLTPLIIEQWKRMAKMNVQEKHIPQESRFLYSTDDRRIDVRIQILPSMFGEALVARLLDQRIAEISIHNLMYREEHKEIMFKHLDSPHGMIICSGPTGSGKTTTLYAAMNYVNKPDRKLMSVEDPVEYYLEGVTQIPVNESKGFTFVQALKCVLRSDPDVVAIGEIRDVESAHIAHSIALTGHIVLTQLHSNGAINALMRIIDVGVPPFLIADAVRLIIGQNLIRKVCPVCAQRTKPEPDQVERAKLRVLDGGINWDSLPKKWVKAVGCKECRQLGYRGRTVINELLEMTSDIRAAIIRGTSSKELWEIAINQGMTSLAAEAVRRAADGETTLQDALAIPSD